MAVVRNTKSLYYATAGDVQTGELIISGFSWTGNTTADAGLTFKDSAGDIVWGPFQGADDAHLTVMFPTPQHVTGLEVDVLDDGVVNVYLV